MDSIEEVKALEARLVEAELGPDPDFFQEILADEVLLDGAPLKSKVVEAHRPGGSGPKFTTVEMTDYRYVSHGPDALVVTCKGTYVGPQWSGTLQFMRVWLKRDGHWQVIAGSTTPVK